MVSQILKLQKHFSFKHPASTNDQQKRKTVKQKHKSSSIAESSANHEAVNLAPIRSLSTHAESDAIETSSTGQDNDKNPRLPPHMSSTTMPNGDQLSGDGESIVHWLRSKDENVNFAGTIPDGKRDDESTVNNSSVITDDLDISGVAVLMTDDSAASSVIDLIESINETRENSEFVKDQRSTTAGRKSTRKPLKRLNRTTATPRYDIAKERTSKGTPYIRNVSSINRRNNLANEIKLSTGKKERIAEEIKKNDNLKRVTFDSNPSMKVSSTATKANQPKGQLESMNKKQSAVKMPRFNDIHKKLFEKMESIDVTVRKREERMMRAASSKKETKGKMMKEKPSDSLNPTTSFQVLPQ